MTGDLTSFDFRGSTVRVVVVDGEPWFVAADVARILGYRDAANAVRTVPEVHRGTHPMSTPGGPQHVLAITEPGLYRLIMRSNVPAAEPFQEWVTADVLPTLRKTGSYGAVRELSRRELAEYWARAEKELEASQAKVAELTPAAHSWTELAEAAGDYSLREAAQILDRDQSISTGQNRLARYLREIGWTDTHGEPYQRQVNAGRLVRRPRSYDHPLTGELVATSQVRVTVKGVHELHRLLGGTGAVLLEVAS